MARSIFDIIGPAMVGPSSSHTLGAVRLATFVRQFAPSPIARALITLHGSFAMTYRGHRTDLAIVGGLIGMNYDDENLIHAFDLAREAGFNYEFAIDPDSEHEGAAASFHIELADGSCHDITGESIGGGMIEIRELDEMKVDITGEYATLITVHRDMVGMVAAITSVLADNRVNIALLKLYRQARFENAILVAQTDDIFGDAVLAKIKGLDGVINAMQVKPLR